MNLPSSTIETLVENAQYMPQGPHDTATATPSPCEIHCQPQQTALVSCMNAIRDAKEQGGHGDGGEKGVNSCLMTTVAAWTECCSNDSSSSWVWMVRCDLNKEATVCVRTCLMVGHFPACNHSLDGVNVDGSTSSSPSPIPILLSNPLPPSNPMNAIQQMVSPAPCTLYCPILYGSVWNCTACCLDRHTTMHMYPLSSKWRLSWIGFPFLTPWCSSALVRLMNSTLLTDRCNAMNPCHNPWIMHGMAQFGMEHVTCVKENEEDYFCKSSVGNGLHFLVAVKAFLS
jgi:hypothetical protein